MDGKETAEVERLEKQVKTLHEAAVAAQAAEDKTPRNNAAAVSSSSGGVGDGKKSWYRFW